MYDVKPHGSLCLNSLLLLNSDNGSLATLLEHLKIDPDSMVEMVRSIQDWYEKQPHLPEGQLHDQLIARLLIMRKFSLEKVKEKIDKYYTVRHNMAELLTNRDPLAPELNTYLKGGYWIVLPRKTPETHRITLFRMKSCDGNSVIESPIMILKIGLMVAEYRLWNDTVLGEHLIFDFESVSIQLVMQMTPVLVSKVVFYIMKTASFETRILRNDTFYEMNLGEIRGHRWQRICGVVIVISCVAPKLKGVHIINLPPYAVVVLNLFKKFLKAKIVSRIHTYNNLDEVRKKFPDSIFPKDLGGTDDKTTGEIADSWYKTLCSPAWRSYFIEQDFIKSDETRRTCRNTINDNFGIDGSFKKLNID